MCKYFLSGSHLYSVLALSYPPSLPRMWPILVPSGTFKDASYVLEVVSSVWNFLSKNQCNPLREAATRVRGDNILYDVLRKFLVKKEELPTLTHSMNKCLLSTYSLYGDKWDTGPYPMKATVMFINNHIFTSIPPHISQLYNHSTLRKSGQRDNVGNLQHVPLNIPVISQHVWGTGRQKRS